MLSTLLFSLAALISEPFTVTGHCYNAADHGMLKSRVTAVFDHSKQQVSTGVSGHFKFRIADSTRSLVFETPGFETRTIPVNKIGNNESDIAFNIAVPMLPNGLDPAIKEDETIFPKTLVILNVDASDLTLPIVFQDESNRKIAEHRPVISTPARRHLTLQYMLPGPYTLAFGLFDSQEKNRADLHFTQKIVINEGINFVKVRYQDTSSGNGGALAKLQPRTLYFDQSSYQLRLESKLALDAVCATLNQRRTVVAQVAGHTDNVGRETLNLILSEYRARVVQHYMKQKGVLPGQIRIEWRGGTLPVAANDTEENKAKNRRVEISFQAPKDSTPGAETH